MRQQAVLSFEDDDPTLAGLRELAADRGVGCRSVFGNQDRRSGQSFCQQVYLIDPSGAIAAFYDKIHMFGVTVSDTETSRICWLSTGERGREANTLTNRLSVCYDVRCLSLPRWRKQGPRLFWCQAHSRPSGAAHWEPLARARSGRVICLVRPNWPSVDLWKSRQTYGHGMAISQGRFWWIWAPNPVSRWLILTLVKWRKTSTALEHDRPFTGLMSNPSITGVTLFGEIRWLMTARASVAKVPGDGAV